MFDAASFALGRATGGSGGGGGTGGTAYVITGAGTAPSPVPQGCSLNYISDGNGGYNVPVAVRAELGAQSMELEWESYDEQGYTPDDDTTFPSIVFRSKIYKGNSVSFALQDGGVFPYQLTISGQVVPIAYLQGSTWEITVFNNIEG